MEAAETSSTPKEYFLAGRDGMGDEEILTGYRSLVCRKGLVWNECTPPQAFIASEASSSAGLQCTRKQC